MVKVSTQPKQAQATLRYLRISPRKVRAAANGLRNRWIHEAEELLLHRNKRASVTLLKLLASASANAVKNNNLSKDNLYVADVFINGGPIFSRYMPRARGSAYEIQKKTSHVTIVVGERKGQPSRKAFTVPSTIENKRPHVPSEDRVDNGVKADAKKFARDNEKPLLKKGFGGIGRKIFSRKAI